MIIAGTEIRFDNAVSVLNAGRQAIAAGDCLMDMKNIVKTDSSAVAVVLDWIRFAQQSGKHLQVEHCPESFLKLVKLYQLTSVIRERTD